MKNKNSRVHYLFKYQQEKSIIYNPKSKIKIKIFGFSLIETLVSIVLIGTVGLIASTSLFNLLAGSAKTEIIKEIKQNGDYAISTMEQNIRNEIDVYHLNADLTTHDCAGSYTELTIVQPTQTIKYSCTGSPTTSLYVTTSTFGTTSLTNDKVAVNNCTSVFTCNINADGKKTVIVNFVLEDVQNPANAQTYRTQINLRNK